MKRLVLTLIIASSMAISESSAQKYEKITFGGGCFWCVEAVFEKINGVEKAISGYMGGTTKNPTYKEICTGLTGHAEVVQVSYDPEKVQLVDLLQVFFLAHDPTTLNRQGADVGTQYRSVIFYYSEKQKQESEFVIAKLNEGGVFNDPIVTEVMAAEPFYMAEDYHQSYYENNSSQPYCRVVISPKLKKVEKEMKDLLKKE